MKDIFKNEIFGTLEPPHGAIIKEGTSLPTSQDIYFEKDTRRRLGLLVQ